jgi:predicted nucleic acid-binding protein
MGRSRVNLFFDTSALVKYFHPEAGTAHVIELMDNASNTLWVSDLARIEFINALYRNNAVATLMTPVTVHDLATVTA